MKRPPILMIINLILLTAGYVCSAYQASGDVIFELQSEKIGTVVSLSFYTLLMIGIYTAVLSRHARSNLLAGVILLLNAFACRPCSDVDGVILLLFFAMGISFIVWSIYLFVNNDKPHENTLVIDSQRYKYWRYTIIVFFAGAVLLGILGCYFGDLSRNHESIQKTLFQIMSCLLLTGLMQIIMYYILSKKKNRAGKESSCPEKTGTETP